MVDFYNFVDEAIELVREERGICAAACTILHKGEILHSKGYGKLQHHAVVGASDTTVFKWGSVSKLVTAVAVMTLVDQGRVALDSPISEYLPKFKPKGDYKEPITLRMILSHQGGLPFESPRGHYFDTHDISLQEVAMSMNDAALMYKPGTHFTYSNADYAVLGAVVESASGVPFEEYVQKHIFDPLGMKNSAFKKENLTTQAIAAGYIATVDDRTLDAPLYEQGNKPAGNLYSTSADMGQFMLMVSLEGAIPGDAHNRILQSHTLLSMFEPQLSTKATFKSGKAQVASGLGFAVANIEGHNCVIHSGLTWGYSSVFCYFPDDKFGIVLTSSADGIRFEDFVLYIAMHAARALGMNVDIPERTTTTNRLSPQEISELAALYRCEETGEWVELDDTYGTLYVTNDTLRRSLRKANNQILGICHRAGPIEPIKRLVNDDIEFQEKTYKRLNPEEFLPEPAKDAVFTHLIGEYECDFAILYLLEVSGQLWVLMGWRDFFPLTKKTETTFVLPGPPEEADTVEFFFEDGSGDASEVQIGTGLRFKRRLKGHNGESFKIKPVRPLDELRDQIKGATVPFYLSGNQEHQLVSIQALDPTIKCDLKYATSDNFLGEAIYGSDARAYLQRPAAEALVKTHKWLATIDLGITVLDAYRPWSATKLFWEAVPEHQKEFVANPELGSVHNRGCAVDVTLYRLSTNETIEMVSGYDEMTDRAYRCYAGGTSHQRWSRRVLRIAMERFGFEVLRNEHWHFNFKHFTTWPVLNIPFSELNGL